MADNETTIVNDALIERMFKAGAHFGYAKSRRHPSNQALIFGAKNRTEIFDLEKTKEYLERAKEFMKAQGTANAKILFVGAKAPAHDPVEKAAAALGMPVVSRRWIGGTFTNFPQIRKRLERLESLTDQREKGELAKYTKKERLLIDREIETLNHLFAGILPMKEFPKVVVVVDSDREHIAVAEAAKLNIPVVAITGSDCDITKIQFPIPGNDAGTASIDFFLSELVTAYKEGQKSAK